MSQRSQGTSAVLRRGGLRLSFAEVLVREMRLHGDTAKSVSDACRIRPADVRAFMAGSKVPSRKEFVRLGHAVPAITYKFRIEDLPTESDSPPETAAGPDAPATKEPEMPPPESRAEAAAKIRTSSERVMIMRVGLLAGRLVQALDEPQRAALIALLEQAAALDMTVMELHQVVDPES